MGKRKEFTGTVISDKMQKTRVVKVTRMSKHPKYGRVLKTANSFKAHDESNATKTGDIVRIVETRPLSKDKRFRIASVVRKAHVVQVEPGEVAI